MVVTIHGRQRFDRHAEVARGHPEVNAELHEPSRGGVTQRVRHDVIGCDVEPAVVAGGLENRGK
jgi:hypothetical protein